MNVQLGKGRDLRLLLLPSEPSAAGGRNQNLRTASAVSRDHYDGARCSLSHSIGRLIRSMRQRSEEGGSLVEFAMVFPILMLIVTAIFTIGIAFNNYLTLTDAVGVAGRALAISSQQTLDPCATAASAVYSAAPLLSQTNLSFSFTINGSSYTGASCSSSNYTTGAAGNLQSGNDATITVTYPCNLTIWGKNYAPSCTLQATTTEKIQ